MKQAEIIGRNLKSLREKRGLTQEEIADYLGISRPIISYYEIGDRPVSLTHLEKLADLFGVEVADLSSEEPLVGEASLAFAFRKEGLSVSDLQSVGNFQSVVRNYLKMKRLKDEKEPGH